MITSARREVRRVLVKHNVKRYEYLKPSEATEKAKSKANCKTVPFPEFAIKISEPILFNSNHMLNNETKG